MKKLFGLIVGHLKELGDFRDLRLYPFPRIARRTIYAELAPNG